MTKVLLANIDKPEQATIAKYREELKIPTSNQRKILY